MVKQRVHGQKPRKKNKEAKGPKKSPEAAAAAEAFASAGGSKLAKKKHLRGGRLGQLAAHGEGIELYRTGSVVGYCMLPLCLLAALAVVLPGGLFTGVVAGVLVMWCTSKATAQFMRSLPQSSDGKRLVVAYPCFTLYCLFALLSVF